jgi:hypothetical protein
VIGLTIEVKVRDKIASVVDEEAYIVCGNSDYEIAFDFDGEWDEYSVKTACFTWNSQTQEVVFEGNVCPAPVLLKTLSVVVGVFAGNLRTSTPALVKAKRSALCEKGVIAPPPQNVYNEIMDKVNEAVKVSNSVREDADNGVFDGEDGHTPVKGVDYWTEEDKQEILSEIPLGVVDQTFDQVSENAQSGVAVYQAIDGIKSQIEYNVGLELDVVRHWCNANADNANYAQGLASEAYGKADQAMQKATELETQMGDIDTALVDIIELQASFMLESAEGVGF